MINSFFKIITFFGFFVLIFSFSLYSQEDITIATYYPSPQGIYQQLTVGSLKVGDVTGEDLPEQDGEVWITGNVGIGTTSPNNKLDVNGSAVIGETYAGTNAAPANGLLVEGEVGIGDTNPDATEYSDVAVKYMKFIPVSDSAYTAEGAVYYDSDDDELKYYDDSGHAQKFGGAQLVGLMAKAFPDPNEAIGVNDGQRAICGDADTHRFVTGIELAASCEMSTTSQCMPTPGNNNVYKITKVIAHCRNFR